MPKTQAPKLGNRRVTGKEQFYTPVDLAMNLTSGLLKLVPDLASRTVLEPAGGTGAFINAARSLGANQVLSFDIEPLAGGVAQADFLATDLSHISPHSAVTISNPPFGRNNSLSIPFFNHAASVSHTIAFIVPRSWRKWTVINRLNPNFHLISDTDVLVDYVGADGKPLANKLRLNTCFQVWQYRDDVRPKVIVQDLGVVKKLPRQKPTLHSPFLVSVAAESPPTSSNAPTQRACF